MLVSKKDAHEKEVEIKKELQETKSQLEEDIDTEISLLIDDYKNKISNERRESLRLKTEIGLYQKKTEFLLQVSLSIVSKIV